MDNVPKILAEVFEEVKKANPDTRFILNSFQQDRPDGKQIFTLIANGQQIDLTKIFYTAGRIDILDLSITHDPIESEARMKLLVYP
jgi:hypothetical protein